MSGLFEKPYVIAPDQAQLDAWLDQVRAVAAVTNPDGPVISDFRLVGVPWLYGEGAGNALVELTTLKGIFHQLMAGGWRLDPDFSLCLVDYRLERDFFDEQGRPDLVYFGYVGPLPRIESEARFAAKTIDLDPAIVVMRTDFSTALDPHMFARADAMRRVEAAPDRPASRFLTAIGKHECTQDMDRTPDLPWVWSTYMPVTWSLNTNRMAADAPRLNGRTLLSQRARKASGLAITPS